MASDTRVPAGAADSEPGTWLIVGCGYVGQAVGKLALARKAARAIIGLRRRERTHTAAFPIYGADVTQPGWRTVLGAQPVTCVVYCAAPGRGQPDSYQRTYVDGLRAVIEGLRTHQSLAPRLILTSSTGIYTENAGGWVDEHTPIDAHASPRIACLSASEALVHAAGEGNCVLRFAGIYGPGRTRITDASEQSPLPLRPHPHMSNHIHRDDCAGSIVHVATMARPQPLYVASDLAPVDYNALLLRLAAARSGGAAHAGPIPQGTATGKQCDSTRLQKDGFVFTYPQFTAHSPAD